MAGLNQPNSRFVGPYVNDCKIDDPMMQRVPLNHMEIGARTSGVPTAKEMTMDQKNSIEHVGGGTKG